MLFLWLFSSHGSYVSRSQVGFFASFFLSLPLLSILSLLSKPSPFGAQKIASELLFMEMAGSFQVKSFFFFFRYLLNRTLFDNGMQISLDLLPCMRDFVSCFVVLFFFYVCVLNLTFSPSASAIAILGRD